MADLLPCPFCGSANIDEKGWASTDSAGPACDDCGASAGGVSNTLQENIAAWNTRVTQPPAVGVDVSKEMIERACESLFPRMTMDADHAGLTVQQRQGMFYVCVRDALTAALRTGGGE